MDAKQKLVSTLSFQDHYSFTFNPKKTLTFTHKTVLFSMITKNNNFFQGNELSISSAIKYSDSSEVKFLFSTHNNNKLCLSINHFTQIYLLSHDIHANRLIICRNLSHLTGTWYLDEIPFKWSFSLKDTFLITLNIFPPRLGFHFYEWRIPCPRDVSFHAITSSRQSRPKWMFTSMRPLSSKVI